MTSAFEDNSHPPIQKDSFLYLQLKKENTILLLGWPKKKKIHGLMKSAAWIQVGQNLWICNVAQSSNPDFQKYVMPVSQLRQRTHKLARPSELLCTYYLLLGQNLLKSVHNSMKPQHLHLQTVWPIIFSSLVMLMQRQKCYFYSNYFTHVIHMYRCLTF